MFSLPYPHHLEKLNKAIATICGIIAAVLIGAFVIGYLFFNINLMQIVPWLWIVLGVVFVIGLICAIGAYGRWHNSASGAFNNWTQGVLRDFMKGFLKVVLILLVAAALLVGVAFVLNKFVGGPVFDLEPIFEKFLSFLK